MWRGNVSVQQGDVECCAVQTLLPTSIISVSVPQSNPLLPESITLTPIPSQNPSLQSLVMGGSAFTPFSECVCERFGPACSECICGCVPILKFVSSFPPLLSSVPRKLIMCPPFLHCSKAQSRLLLSSFPPFSSPPNGGYIDVSYRGSVFTFLRDITVLTTIVSSPPFLHMFLAYFRGLHGSSGKLTGSSSSLNKLAVQGSSSRRSQSSSLLDMGNMSASDLDVADRTKFDKIFEQVLSELEPLCLAEQDFISKFFKLQQHPSVGGTQGDGSEVDGSVQARVPPTGEHRHSMSEKDMVRWMMNSIFHCIEVELNSLIALGDKMDSFHSLYMLVKMSHHVWTAENVDPASFLSTTLGNVLVTVKRNFDKCISSQIRQMEEVKISKKSKVGILPFVSGFEEFAELAETIFRNAERRGDLDKAYAKLIRAVYMNGNTLHPIPCSLPLTSVPCTLSPNLYPLLPTP
ncbi:hypothetical protein JZ751_016629 [Albula glossodonta]|uniref:Exocyst complex component Sec3 C-terminal domain-containing protein n=1 Tax=Albula glossodonta TaxID=121402 RepID=A0A8T2N0I0_9TELE|nr:hypothetical protein JZ751_016629 [Albula glossodonta]